MYATSSLSYRRTPDPPPIGDCIRGGRLAVFPWVFPQARGFANVKGDSVAMAFEGALTGFPLVLVFRLVPQN